MPTSPTVLRGAAAAVLLAALLLIGGCGSDTDDEAPAACLATNDVYLRALERAPAEVRLAGGTPISACLVPEQDAGELANVGREMIVAATKLNTEARKDPEGSASVQLGYLLGATAKGADAIHTDLVRRLNTAARFSEGGGSQPAGFERAFGRGYAAGQGSG
jgi:hypothetical protein